jgi:hypothetical protein
MLQYVCLLLDAWEKDVDKEKPGSSFRKDFKYPPVLPIIFYDGKDHWTAEKNFLGRTNLNGAFEKYIPKFEYELVNLNDYSEEDIKGIGDTLSLIMLIDKLRGSGEESLLKHLPPDYVKKLNLQIPEDMVKLLSDVIRVLLDKSKIDRGIAGKLASYIERGEEKEYQGMFEAVIESILEEREEARKQGIALGQEQGRVEGIALGEERSREEIARNALAEGLTPEFIHTITGLDLETIKSLS